MANTPTRLSSRPASFAQDQEKAAVQIASEPSGPGLDRPVQNSGDPVLRLQRTLGNHRVCQLLQSGQLTRGGKIAAAQCKLIVGGADDQYEREADRVARHVMNASDAGAPMPMPRSMPMEGNKRQDEKLNLHRQAETKEQPDLTESFEAGDAVESRLNQSKGRGSPLPDPVRSYMEPRFGVDFSEVRVHTGADATHLNRSVGAQAFTHGSDIYFGEGRDPSNSELTAHELTHVVQQTGAIASKPLDRLEDATQGPSNTLQRQPAEVVPDDALQEKRDPFEIEGGQYSAKEQKHAAEAPSGLILTATIIGKQERKLSETAPSPLSVSKDWMRFEGGKLGEFVYDYNDFAEYMFEVLSGIGRLRDLLSTGAPALPEEMTAQQTRSMRPTDDTAATALTKRNYHDWRTSQAKYATTGDDGLPEGVVFDVAKTGRAVELAREAFWQAKGDLSQTISEAKKLNKPQYEALELKFGDALTVLSAAGPEVAAGAAIVVLADSLVSARKKRAEYDAKMKIFAEAVSQANDSVKRKFEAFRGADRVYWEQMTAHQIANHDVDKARVQSRSDAAMVGQAAAGSETRPKVLAEMRMPWLVADAWHALASIGPTARKKLSQVLAAQAVVVSASKKDLSWMDPNRVGATDIIDMRQAQRKAMNWDAILTKEDVQYWVNINGRWEEKLTKFDV